MKSATGKPTLRWVDPSIMRRIMTALSGRR
ncbi:hypothetical protein ACVXG7_27410 [Enterobacter hormaechei]